MNNNIIIILLIVLLIFLYFNFVKEKFQGNSTNTPENTPENQASSCKFDPETTSTWGTKKLDSLGDELVLKSRDECILTCSELDGCDTEACISKCSKCKNKNICEWIPDITCKYKPKGSTIHSCIDTCINRVKDDDSCGENFEDKYKTCGSICRRCNDPVECKWNDKIKKRQLKCYFKPWGPDLTACQDRCLSQDNKLWGGSDCTINICKDICESCTNSDYCKWLGQVEKEDTESYLLEDYEDKPPSQIINIIPGNRRAVIQWTTRQHENPKYKIIGYIIQYFKTFKQHEGIMTENIESVEDLFDDNNENEFIRNNNTYELNNLTNGDNYSIALIPVNINGSGKESNLVSIVPEDNLKINFK